MAQSNQFGENRQNFFKLSGFLTVEGGNILRELISMHVHPTSSRDYLKDQNNEKIIKKKLQKHESARLYPGTDLDKCDISLLYALHRNVLYTGGKWPVNPQPTDQSTEANIQRLKDKRNKIAGHSPNAEIELADFKAEWLEVKDILKQLGVTDDVIEAWERRSYISEEILQNIKSEFKVFSEIIDLKAHVAKEANRVIDHMEEEGNRKRKYMEEQKHQEEEHNKEMNKKLKTLDEKQDQASQDNKDRAEKQLQATKNVSEDVKKVGEDVKNVADDVKKASQDNKDRAEEQLQATQNVGEDVKKVGEDVKNVADNVKKASQDNKDRAEEQLQATKNVGEDLKKASQDNKDRAEEQLQATKNVGEDLKKAAEENEKRGQQLLEAVTKRTEAKKYTAKEIKIHSIKQYKKLKLNDIQALPGEIFLVDMKNLMPLDFTAKERKCDEQHRAVLPPNEIKWKYKPLLVEKIEEIINTLQGEESSRLVLCEAAAGCGKTVYSCHLLREWIKQADPQGTSMDSSPLKDIDLLFVIPIRNIKDIKADLTEILASGRTGLEYIENSMIDSLTNIMNDKKQASKVLMCIDGLDELTIPEDTELFKLITGKLYPCVNVFLTSRPEATILESLRKLNPRIKVKIYGTTDEGVESYLLGCCEDREEEGLALIKRCQEEMVEPHLLRVPLYLTIMGYLFDSHWKERMTLKDFIVPETATQLFIALMNILLRVWIEKLGRKEEAAKLLFTKSPLDESSNLPADMKRTLLQIAKMSYKALKKKKYDFAEKDFKKYHIGLKEASASGLFCIPSDREQDESGMAVKQQDEYKIYYRHKQIQEFMAAVYLCEVRFQEPSFQELINSTVIKKKRKKRSTVNNSYQKSLIETFKGLETCMYFTFGLCLEFSLEILNKLKGHLCVANLPSPDGNLKISLDYESRLCFESGAPTLYDTMRQVMVSCLPVEKKCDFRSPMSTIQSLCVGLTSEQNRTLLTKWCGLNVYEEGEDWEIQETGEDSVDREEIQETGEGSGIKNKDNKLEIDAKLYLNETLYFLLSRYTFPAVKSLVLKSDITDISIITQVFPQLQDLDIVEWTEKTELEVFVRNHHTLNTQNTLTQIRIDFADTSLPHYSIVHLLQQTQLESLALNHMDISCFSKVQCDVRFPQLHTLYIGIGGPTAQNYTDQYSGLTRLLEGAPELQSLTYGGYLFKLASTLTGSRKADLLRTMAGNLPKLTTLRLCFTPNIKTLFQPTDIQSACDHLQQMPALTTLGLEWRDIKGRETEWLEKLYTLPQLHTLQVLYFIEGEKFKAESVVTSLQQSQQHSNLQVEVLAWSTLF